MHEAFPDNRYFNSILLHFLHIFQTGSHFPVYHIVYECLKLNEANGETTKDDKWTQIIDGMTIYTDTALKEYLEQAGFCKIQNHKNKKGWLCITAQK